jgi:hypothetical protein
MTNTGNARKCKEIDSAAVIISREHETGVQKFAQRVGKECDQALLVEGQWRMQRLYYNYPTGRMR